MYKIITGFLGWVLKPIIAVLDLLPGLPAELVDVVHSVLGYMGSGMGILNFFCPIILITPAIYIFITLYSVKHGYEMVIWILKKIPFIGVE